MQITEFKYDCFDPILPFLGEKTSKIENGIYYYHADHLGSSSVVTDKNGKFHEHLEYFPYGETWINDRANNENLPYRFTGKELDPETGLYFYGARYYDAKLSRWISADPILNSYLDGRRGLGGVYNSNNLDMYHYCANNPVMYSDLTGTEDTPAGRCVDTQIVFKCTINEGNNTVTAGSNNDYRYSIVQSTRSTNTGGNMPIYNATTGERTGDYQAGNFYINKNGKIYDVTDVALTEWGGTVGEYLTHSAGSRGGNPVDLFIRNGRTIRERFCPWLDKSDLDALNDEDFGNQSLYSRIKNQDDVINNRYGRGRTRDSDAAAWEANHRLFWNNRFMGYRCNDDGTRTIIQNGAFYTQHSHFSHNVKNSNYWKGSYFKQIYDVSAFWQETLEVLTLE